MLGFFVTSHEGGEEETSGEEGFFGGTPGFKGGEVGGEVGGEARGEEGAGDDFVAPVTGGGEVKERLPLVLRGFFGGVLTGALGEEDEGGDQGGGVRLIAPDSRARAILGGIASCDLLGSHFGDSL